MAGAGDNECAACNNDTSFMIIGLIPNLLAPLFVLQEKKKKKKEKGKEEKGDFRCCVRSLGSPKRLRAKGAGSGGISPRVCGTLQGIARPLAAAVAMVMEGVR